MSLARSRAFLLALAAAAALAVAGCGDDEEEDTAAQDTATEETTAETGTDQAGGQPAASLEVVATDFEFDPENGTVDEDGQVEFELVNEGESPHALEIEAEQEFVSDTINPGQSTTLTAQLDSGEYVWYCPVGNHRELGMEGTITVGGGGGSGDDDSGGGGSSGDDDSGGGGSSGDDDSGGGGSSGDDDSGGGSAY